MTNILFILHYCREAGASFTKGLRLSQVLWLCQGPKSKTLVLARFETLMDFTKDDLAKSKLIT